MAPYDIGKVGIKYDNERSVARGAGVLIEKQQSEAENIIDRINNKINSLYDILRPIYLDNSKPEVVDEEIAPQLIQALRNTEYKITQLLDGIRI